MRVSIGDVRLYFDVEGAGLVPVGAAMAERPTLLLLHGGPGVDHTLFKPEFATMADTAQVVYLDQRGSGRSDRGVPPQWTWEQWADDVAAFCAALDITRPVLVGASSGGMIALVCAARHPGLVGALVLDSSFGGPMTLDESLAVFARRGGEAAREAARRHLTGDGSPEALAAWQEYCLPLYGGADEGGRNDLADRLARVHVNDVVQAHFHAGGCGTDDVTPLGAAITCPTLVLAGADDPVTPVVSLERLAASLVNAPVRLEVFGRVGHGVFRQAPGRAFALLREFLAGKGVRSSPERVSSAQNAPRARSAGGRPSGS